MEPTGMEDPVGCVQSREGEPATSSERGPRLECRTEARARTARGIYSLEEFYAVQRLKLPGRTPHRLG
ncbi:hypothetical protein CRUP_037438 [Coryphaenoides rupestris]|nr:hypothetical protein CRUP_037438 [Coryphaenoides rupestris]